MGTISSIYIGPALSEPQSNSRNDERESDRSESEADYSDEGKMECKCERRKSVMEVRLSHSLSSLNDTGVEKSRENELGATIQYLAEENVRLVKMNKKLTNEVEKLKKEKEGGGSSLVFGETPEQKISRLERTLAVERQEKWESIEKGERNRVDLVNCERDLSDKLKTIEELTDKLESNKRHINELEESLKRLKSIDSNDSEIESENADIREKSSKAITDLETFRADLREKRESRRKAISAVSSEMQKLRDELECEKEKRRKLEREIVLNQNPTDLEGELPVSSVQTENEVLKKELSSLTDDIEKLKDTRTENKRLKLEIKKLGEDISSLNTVILQLKNDYKEEKRRHERTKRGKEELEEENDRNFKMRKDLETEKERMWQEYDKEKAEIDKRTNALKEVIEISKQMLVIRESQVQELKAKLKEIEKSVHKSRLLEEDGLKAEYVKQLENIKTLKELYEERTRLMEVERDRLQETINQHKKTIEDQKSEIEELKEQCGNANEKLEKEKLENQSLERDLKISIARSNDFENELTVINNMFTQMLLGPFNSGNETDLDKLTELLQENHELITEMTTKEESSEIASALPKLLLDLITQVEGNENVENDKRDDRMTESTDTISEQSESILAENQGAVLPILSYKNATIFKNPIHKIEEDGDEKCDQETVKHSDAIHPAVQEIVTNLPKVWKVLMELLSIHSTPEFHTSGDEKQCYKNVETPHGTRSVISVSNTFLRLKDLILEKKSLQKELVRLKQLNSHLESRLDDQEKRLSEVQCELHKTWGVVGRMRAQHQQLHNHEKILRYELQEKRVMLGELKQELEYCRDKWERARQKNNESETEWRKLRREFAARKIKGYIDPSLNDSAESGFSDEPNESGEEAENFDADRSSTQSPIDRKVIIPAEIIASLKEEEEASTSEQQSSTSQPSTVERSETVLENKLPEKSDGETAAGTSQGAIPKTNLEKSNARALKLKRLEDECQLLVSKVDITTHKSNMISSRLEDLHENCVRAEEIRRPITLKDPQKSTEDGNNPQMEICRATVNQIEEAAICLSEMENTKPVTYAYVSSNSSEQGKLKEVDKKEKTFDEIMKAREERMKRLEEQCQSLVGKVSNTIQKGSDLSNKLNEMHQDYLTHEASKSRKDFEKETEESTQNVASDTVQNNDLSKVEDLVETSSTSLSNDNEIAGIVELPEENSSDTLQNTESTHVLQEITQNDEELVPNEKAETS